MPQHEDWLLPYLPTNKQKVALVLGAHEGLWVRRLCPLFDRIVAVEPSPDAIDKLRELNIENVTVVPSAAWIVGQANMILNVRSTRTMNNALACRDLLRNVDVSQTIEVDTVTVDGLNLEACDFILCDVEGAEIQALMGATATIERFKPDLIIECHEIEHRNWLLTWLERCGYNIAIFHDPDRDMNDDWYRHVYLIAEHYRFRGAL